MNQFAVLEQDISSPSTPIYASQNDFTFRYPTASVPLSLETATSTALPTPPASSPPSIKLVFKRSRLAASTDNSHQNVPTSPLLPSIPTTPIAKPRVKIPGTFPEHASSPPQLPILLSTSGYLDGIKIPSPLLYHKRSRELLERSSDYDINAELTKTFLLTCGRDVPEPDFESYKLFDDEAVSPLVSEKFVAAALPKMGSDLTDSCWSRNIPHAPWIEHTSFTVPEPYMTIPSKSHFGLGATTRRRSDSGATVIRHERLASCDDLLSCNGPSSTTNFVFPTLPMNNDLLQEPQPACTPQSAKATTTTTGFIDDDAETVCKRWAAFEDAIKRFTPSATVPIAAGTPRQVATYKSDILHQTAASDFVDQPMIDVAACPTSTCTALVPARLYEHQFLGWPKRISTQPEYEVTNYPILRASLTGVSDEDKALKMVRWIQELGFDNQHKPRCSVPDDVKASFDEDFKVSLDDEASPLNTAATSPSELVDASPSDAHDEGYFTCAESDVEVLVDEAPESDADWTDWSWPTEDEEQDGGGVDIFGIGLAS